MDFRYLNLIESEISNGNYDSAFKYAVELSSSAPASALAFIATIRVIKRLATSDKSTLMREQVEAFIFACKESKKRTMDYWPLISHCNRHIMRADDIKMKNFEMYLEHNSIVKAGRPKILILTCVWKRPDLTEAFYRYYRRIQVELAEEMEIQLLCVGSEGDKSYSACKNHGFHYVESPNQPLTAKWQKGMDEAKKISFDGMVILGSDDFIEKEIFLLYKKNIENNTHFYGFQDLYLYHVDSKKFGHWKGYGSASGNIAQPERVGETIGLGRFLSKELLNYLSFNIWTDIDANKGLDRLMKGSVIEKTGMLPVARGGEYEVTINGEVNRLGLVADTFESNGLIGVDVKHETNVTDFSKYDVSTECYSTLEPERLLELDFSVELEGFLRSQNSL